MLCPLLRVYLPNVSKMRAISCTNRTTDRKHMERDADDHHDEIQRSAPIDRSSDLFEPVADPLERVSGEGHPAARLALEQSLEGYGLAGFVVSGEYFD